MNNFLHQLYLNQWATRSSISVLSKDFFQNLKKAITNYLNNYTEPKVWQSISDQGDIIWHIYYPKTGRSGSFTSEEEARIWIEEQYYHELYP